MPLDVLEADRVGLAQTGDGGAALRCLDTQGVKYELIVRLLQRDDPLRRSYLLKRWQSQAGGRCDIEASSSATAPNRR